MGYIPSPTVTPIQLVKGSAGDSTGSAANRQLSSAMVRQGTYLKQIRRIPQFAGNSFRSLIIS